MLASLVWCGPSAPTLDQGASPNFQVQNAFESSILRWRSPRSLNFASEFLHGREGHFAGAYQWAFYTHIISGPVSLILGLILIGERSRARFPKGHRYLG